MVTKLQLAYIAGFFDGEGSIHGHITSGAPQVRVTITQKNPEILYWIQKVLNMGRVRYFPTSIRGGRW